MNMMLVMAAAATMVASQPHEVDAVADATAVCSLVRTHPFWKGDKNTIELRISDAESLYCLPNGNSFEINSSDDQKRKSAFASKMIGDLSGH